MSNDDHGVALCFPGQGVPTSDIRSALTAYRDHDLVLALVEKLSVSDVDDLDLTDTRVAQPTMLALGLARARIAVPSSEDVRVVIGHSFGELTALAFASALSDTDALDLAILRGKLCWQQNRQRPGSMLAVMGLDPIEVEWIRRRTLSALPAASVEIAAVNSEKQVVLSGDPPAMRSVSEQVTATGADARTLPIAGAFHNPHMAGALVDWTAGLERVPIAPPRTTFISSTSLCECAADDELRRVLARALVLPVRWREVVAALPRHGVTRLVDCGPGHVLRKLARRQPMLESIALSELASPLSSGGRKPT